MPRNTNPGPRTAGPGTAAPGTASQLLDAATDLFGRHGYDGVTTRMLASQAGSNLSAIKYHFGGKEELYVAVLDQIISSVQPRVRMIRELANHARELAADDRQRQAHLVHTVITTALQNLLGHPDIRRIVPIVLRELAMPSRHFDRLYDALPRQLHETLTELVAWVDGSNPEDPAVVVRSHALIGTLVVFLVGRPVLLRRLQQSDDSPELLASISREVSRVVLAALELPAPAAVETPS